MAKAKVLVTGVIPEGGLTELKQLFAVTHVDADRDWVLAHLADYDAFYIKDIQADKELIDAGPNLKIIVANGVGYDHIDVAYAKEKGIVVSNCPTSVRMATAEMTIALLLATVRRLHYYDHTIREGQWIDVSEPVNMGMSLQDKTLGVFGMGRIGKTVTQFAQAIGMKVIYFDQYRLDRTQEDTLGVRFVSFDELVTTADVITLHAPALPSTHEAFNAHVFKQMKPTAYFINAARGALVNQADLIAALRNHDIAGAGVDVFANEPGVPSDFYALDNIIMTPHAGTGTNESRTATAIEATENLRSFLIDGQPKNWVNQ
ncbi:MAG: dihydrofolate reductase [Lactobacillus sp.]|jgi:D-3-phosphoglycerate dehydrogenase|nr:dihydrofolate reductase [Lactobacillus sp.]MCI2033366.1 dihydrofolate reductase [Lactobacillus sp.]